MEGERTALETVETVVRSVDSLSREEVQQIVALINLAYRLHVAFFPNDRTDYKNIYDEIAGHEMILLLASPSNKLVATAHVHPDGNALYLGLAAVDPHLHNRGYGAQLLQAGSERARQLGLSKVRLTAILETGNVAYYLGQGYRVMAEVPQPLGTWGSTIPFTLATLEKSFN